MRNSFELGSIADVEPRSAQCVAVLGAWPALGRLTHG
jgi:hypothetical protein